MSEEKEESIEAYVETKSRGNLYQEMAKSDPLGLFSSVGFTPYNPSVLVSRKGMKVFDDMRRDEQVKAAMGFKKHAALSSGWEIVSPKGQAGDWEVTEFIKWNLTEYFEDTIEEALLGVLTALDYGYSVSELIWEKSQTKEHGNKIVLKAIKNKRPHEFDFKADEYGELLSDGIIQRTGMKDVPLPISKFVLFSYEKEFGNHYGKSDLESVYRSWWIKDNAYKWFAMMLERLGIPPIFALYDPSAYTKEQLIDLKTVISRLQAATTGIIPKGRGENSLEFWNPELAGESTTVFTKAFERFDLDITRALLMPGLIGATGDATQGSLARANVHFDMFMLAVEYLRGRIEDRVMQEQIVKRLVDLNYVVDEYPTFKFLPIAGEIRTELLTTYITAVEKGIVVKQESDEIHLRKELGFPEVDEDRPEPAVEPTPEELAAKKTEEEKAAAKLKEEEEAKKFSNPNHDESGRFASGQGGGGDIDINTKFEEFEYVGHPPYASNQIEYKVKSISGAEIGRFVIGKNHSTKEIHIYEAEVNSSSRGQNIGDKFLKMLAFTNINMKTLVAHVIPNSVGYWKKMGFINSKKASNLMTRPVHIKQFGGEGSGNWGHSGRPGEVGGSGDGGTNRDRLIARGNEIKTKLSPFLEKEGMTSSEYLEYEKLVGELQSIKFDLAKPLTIEKALKNREENNILSPEVIVAAQHALLSDKNIYTIIANAAAGAAFNKNTGIDDILEGVNPNISKEKFIKVFEPVRIALRKQYGDYALLFRAEGKQMHKITQNWASTKQFAAQFGGNITEKKIPIDSIVAVNVGLKGKYHELIVITESKQFSNDANNFSQAPLSREINKYEQVVNFNRIDTGLTDIVNTTKEALVKALTDSREALKSFVSRNWDKLPTLVKDIKIKGMNDVESILREFMRVTFEVGRTELKAETYSVSNFGGEGSGNWNHSGRPGEIGGSSDSEGGGFGSIPPGVNSETMAERSFYAALNRATNSGGVYVSHETTVDNVDSIKRKGLNDGSFGTLGVPSNFILSEEKARVWIKIPKGLLHNISPDMRYDPDKPFLDLVKQHPKLRGADVSLNFEVPVSWIVRIDYVKGGKVIKQFNQIQNMAAGKGLFTPTEALQYLNSKAFWIKGIIRDQLVKEAQAIIYNAIQTGELPAETIQKLHNVFEPYIGDINIIVDDEQLAPYRLETILRTNATDAFNQGRLTEARSFSPGLILAMEFSAILDDRTTEICGGKSGGFSGLDGRLFRMDDPDLDRFKPPLHFNCRSMLVAVPAGIEIDQKDFVTGEIKGTALDLMSPGLGGNITKLAQEYGGEGSGNWGHSGRPGEVGGSGEEGVNSLEKVAVNNKDKDINLVYGPVTVEAYRVGSLQDSIGRGVFFGDSEKSVEAYRGIHKNAAVKKYVIDVVNPIIAKNHNALHKELFGMPFNDGVDRAERKIIRGGNLAGDRVLASRQTEVKMAKELVKRGYDSIIYTSPPLPAKHEIAVLDMKYVKITEQGEKILEEENSNNFSQATLSRDLMSPGFGGNITKLAQEYGGEGSGNWNHLGRPGEVGGSGDEGGGGKGGGSVERTILFHGTIETVIKDIKLNGLVADRPKRWKDVLEKRNLSDAIFVSTSEQEAKNWGERAAYNYEQQMGFKVQPIILKIEVSSAEFTKNFKEDSWDNKGKDAFFTQKKIESELIKEAYYYTSVNYDDKKVKVFGETADKDISMYTIILVEATNNEGDKE